LSIQAGISISYSKFFLILLFQLQVPQTFSIISQDQLQVSQGHVCSIVPKKLCCLYFTYQVHLQSGQLFFHSHHSQLHSGQEDIFSYLSFCFHQTILVFKSILNVISISSHLKLFDFFLELVLHHPQKNDSKISHKSTSNQAQPNHQAPQKGLPPQTLP
jgi:hypothetical protein